MPTEVMRIQTNIDLQSHNTLALPCEARWYCAAQNTLELAEAISWSKRQDMPYALLGGGSNILLPERIDGLVIQLTETGWQEVRGDNEFLWVKVAAGQNWNQWVAHCVHRGWCGLENLALIPGTVGAAPIQNIGAYGVEVSQCIATLTWLDFASQELSELDVAQCQFAYRDSVFKGRLRGRGAITHVTFRLSRTLTPQLSYPGLEQSLAGGAITAQTIYDAVCAIRRQKLPDPDKLPNCGSFFKNPIIPLHTFKLLQRRHRQMPHFAVAGTADQVKIPAAWLIDQAGWKGREEFGVAVHQDHALVIVNPRRCGLSAILKCAELIVDDVYRQFAISLEREPQLFMLSTGLH